MKAFVIFTLFYSINADFPIPVVAQIPFRRIKTEYRQIELYYIEDENRESIPAYALYMSGLMDITHAEHLCQKVMTGIF